MTTTAIVRVVCRADRFEQTARLLAWAMGHPVGFSEPAAVAITRSLFIDTGLAYDDRSELVPSDFALDMVGLIPGVLSWGIVPSDVVGAVPGSDVPEAG
jgi:hypothetical protein